MLRKNIFCELIDIYFFVYHKMKLLHGKDSFPRNLIQYMDVGICNVQSLSEIVHLYINGINATNC
jgi:hypothetical protein